MSESRARQEQQDREAREKPERDKDNAQFLAFLAAIVYKDTGKGSPDIGMALDDAAQLIAGAKERIAGDSNG